jgi:hypothetical protein
MLLVLVVIGEETEQRCEFSKELADPTDDGEIEYVWNCWGPLSREGLTSSRGRVRSFRSKSKRFVMGDEGGAGGRQELGESSQVFILSGGIECVMIFWCTILKSFSFGIVE